MKNEVKTAIENITDAELEEIREEDERMMNALKQAPKPVYFAWKSAQDALGMISDDKTGDLVANKIAQTCCALSSYAEQLAKEERTKMFFNAILCGRKEETLQSSALKSMVKARRLNAL